MSNYTDEQIRFLLANYKKHTRSEITRLFNKKFKTNLSINAIRKTYARNLDKFETILLISDLHMPYHHKDTIRFLQAVKAKYLPTRVILGGDEVDNHAISFHDSDCDLPSAGDELERSIKELQKLYKLFPKADVLHSNHGSLVIRKFKHHGIPMKYLKDIGEVLEAPETWKWHNTMTIDLINGQKLFLHHGLKKNGIKLAQEMGMNTAQFHFHTEFNIQYSGNPSQLIWSVQCGCLIDDKALSFAYNKLTPSRPVLGCAIIVNGQPKLLPMVIEDGDWIGELV